MSKVALASIKSLTFYEDGVTTARRTEPIPQLNCIGKACSLYTPEAIRCTNVGGHGTDIDWKCEADLPEALRFGRVEVSCEGWSGPGDPFVLKGSCALNYRLVEVPDMLRRTGEHHSVPSYFSRLFQGQDIGGTIFMTLWVCLVLYIVYKILVSCLMGPRPAAAPNHRPGGQGGGFNSGWFPGGYRHDDSSDPPPPYSKSTPSGGSQAASGNWQPGFWTGAAAAGLGTYLWNRNQRPQTTFAQRSYDWERPQGQRYTSHSSFSSPRRPFSSSDRGEGSSSGLGAMRSSAGIGGSSVR